MKAKDYFEIGMKRLQTFNPQVLMPALRFANDGAIEDVMNSNGCAYYQWSVCLIDELKPKQIVELGGAMGVWDVCVLYTLPKDSKLYSITLPEFGLEFSYVKDTYKNFVPTVGDDVDINVWPKDMDWSKTDILLIDSLHEESHLRKELNLYIPLLKKGTLLLLDDIRINEGMTKVWNELLYEKYEATDPLHYSGFGICIL